MSDSQNPIVYMATATELATVNMRPMAPPNSGPRDLEKNNKSIKKEIGNNSIWYHGLQNKIPAYHVIYSSRPDLSVG